MPPIAAPVKPGAGSSGTASIAPKSSGTGTAPKAETPKATAMPLAPRIVRDAAGEVTHLVRQAFQPDQSEKSG